MKTVFQQIGTASRFVAFTLDLERRAYLPHESDIGVRGLKIFTTLVIMFLAMCAIIALWQVPLLLTFVLCLLAWLKRILFPIKLELLWFLVVGSMGAYAESLIIHASRAWAYTNPQYLAIPLWLPAIWGLLTTSLLTAYSAVTGGIHE